jgi:nitrite reductase (NO-forming)
VIVAGGVAAGVLLLGAGVVGVFVAVYGFDTNVTKRVSGHGAQVERIALTDFDVTPGTLVVDRGTHLVLEVVNEGDEVHDLALEDGGLRTRMLEPGQSQRLDLGHVTGALVCTVPLHKSLGMTLDVRVANGAERPHSAAHQPKRKRGTGS